MSQKRIRRTTRMQIKDIKTEEGSEELVKSPEMRPYVRLAKAAIQGQNIKAALDDIAQIPLEKRYVWRVVLALKWAFADFDDLNVVADRETLLPEDHSKLADLLKFRPIQFCLFLKALMGEEAMEQMMAAGIAHAKESGVPGFTRSTSLES